MPTPSAEPRTEIAEMKDDEKEIARARRLLNGRPYLNTEQAAAYLGISVWRMKEMRKGQNGPRFRYHSRYVRYLIDDLVLWSRSTTGAPATPGRGPSKGEKSNG